MSWFCRSKKNLMLFDVVVHLNGKHPYIRETDELDYKTRDISMTVPARSWNEAAEIALQASYKFSAWGYSVVSITCVRDTNEDQDS